MQVGLINKPTLNVVDPAMMKTLAAAPFVLVVEAWNVKTGLGSRFGSYLLQAGPRESTTTSAHTWKAAAAYGNRWGTRAWILKASRLQSKRRCSRRIGTPTRALDLAAALFYGVAIHGAPLCL